MKKILVAVTVLSLTCLCVRAQEKEWINYGATANYDETTIPRYSVPDVLAAADGSRITDIKTWEKRRVELLELLQKEMYGYMPAHPSALHFKVENEDANALGGKAVRKEVKVFVTADESKYFTMLMYVPAGKNGPVPAFLTLNFQGNHTICDDPGITIYDTTKVATTRFMEIKKRGLASSRWPVEMIVDSGYALATVFYEDMACDVDDNPFDGILPLGYNLGPERTSATDLKEVMEGEHPVGSEWGTICSWAWGLSCAMDYLVTDSALDPHKIAVLGHSRLGKTALWAAAMDSRFAMSVSSCSGCCGAALSRRVMGETLAAVEQNAHQWFTPEFDKYSDRENELPFDQHFLIALIAPRPVYITSATEDIWADPHGEFLSGKLASPVYALYGEKGLVTDLSITEPAPSGYVRSSGYKITNEWNGGTTCGPARDKGNVISDGVLFKGYPRADTPLQDGFIAYHVRTGEHDITSWDWQQILSFADKRLK